MTLTLISRMIDFRLCGANRPWCTMPGIFVGYTFLKAHSIPFKMTLVCTLSVGAFWRGGLLNTSPICHFTVYTKCVIKYAYDFFSLIKS